MFALICVPAGIAQAGVPGDGQPPKTKKECLQILKKDQRAYADERKTFPARKKAATDKIAALDAKADVLKAKYEDLQAQIDAITNSDTTGLSLEEVDALNAKIDALSAQQRKVADKAAVADGKTDEAREALKTLKAKHRDDMKNWPVIIRQVKSYCAKM